MWSDEVVPRLRERGLGADVAIRTFRLTGIGESAVAEILGEELLRRGDPRSRPTPDSRRSTSA